MAIVITCTCGSRYRVKDEYAGKTVKCAKCGTGISVPAASPAPPPAPIPVQSPPPPPPPPPVQPAVPWTGAATGPRQAVMPISKGFFLWSWIIGVGIATLGQTLAGPCTGYRRHLSDRHSLSIWELVTSLPGLYAGIVFLVLIYKLWAALQPFRDASVRDVRTTPGKAIGFLFIPFYNIYWFFQAVWGWTRDYNRVIDRLQIHAPRASEGLVLIFCIMELFSGGPMGEARTVQLLILALGTIFVAGGCDAINALAGRTRHLTEAPPEPKAMSSKAWSRCVAGGLLAIIGCGYGWALLRLSFLLGRDRLSEFSFDSPSDRVLLTEMFWGPMVAIVCVIVGMILSVKVLMAPATGIQGIRRKQISLAGVLLSAFAIVEIICAVVMQLLFSGRTFHKLFGKSLL